jgi:hypothetical protein
MQLRAGFTFAVAPRFHSDLTWADRLELNSGVRTDRGRVFARQEWRPPTDDELSVLLADSVPSTFSRLAPEHAGIFTIPSHLREGWWVVAEDGDTPEGNTEEYDRFVVTTIDFLHFKQLPLPQRCRFDLVASRPGQVATRLDAEELAGMMPAANADNSAGRLVAMINLGDEPTHLALLNLGVSQVRALLGERADDAGTPGAAYRQFFAAFPDYPLIRVGLEPSEGLWLPEAAAIWDGDTQGKEEPDIVLLIREEPE